jgi:hypothetical protein
MQKPPRKPDFHASKHHDKPRRLTVVLVSLLLVALTLLGILAWLTF